jgi:hypothetical protein
MSLDKETKQRYERLEKISEQLKKKDGSYTTQDVAQACKDWVVLSERQRKLKGKG